MRKRLVTLVLFTVAGCSKGRSAGRDPRFDALAAQVEAERASDDVPGVSVALMQSGEVVWSEGFGSRLADGNKPADARTLYRIGSCTKMLTATALLRRVDDGTVSLDEPLTTYVPAFHLDPNPGEAGSITIRNLLTHSSGLYDYLTIDGSTLDSQLETFLTASGPSNFGGFEYLMDPPGSFWNYSNPNFYLAGLVDQKVTGTGTWRQILHDEVLAPLGMKRTYFLADDVLHDGDYATGRTYDWVHGTSATMIAGPGSYDNAWARPAGYAWSSVLDEAKFASFLLDGNTTVLSDALRSQMQSEVVNTDNFLDQEYYGYGLLVDEGFQLGSDFYAVKLVSHDGAIPGFSAEMFIVPSTRFAFIVLANTDDAYFPGSVVKAIHDFAGLPAPTTPPDPGIVPADFPNFAGSYQDPYNVGAIAIGVTSGNVTISMPALDAASIPYQPTLTPVSRNNFVLNVQNTDVLATFILGTSGTPQYFRTRPFVGVRQPSFAITAQPPLPGAAERLLRALAEARHSAPRLGLPAPK